MAEQEETSRMFLRFSAWSSADGLMPLRERETESAEIEARRH